MEGEASEGFEEFVMLVVDDGEDFIGINNVEGVVEDSAEVKVLASDQLMGGLKGLLRR